MRGFAKQIGDITTIMVAILGAVFFTILLVAGNTMAQSVRERTEELGVLKALVSPAGRSWRSSWRNRACSPAWGGGRAWGSPGC